MNKVAAPPVDDPVVDEAIAWLMLLQSRETSEDDQRAFAAWQASDPRHEAAFSRLRSSVQDISRPVQLGLATGDVRQALRVAAPSRRKALGRIAVLAGVGLSTKGVFSYFDLGADLRTATAERRDWTLEDGTVVKLNARSAASLDFTREHRRVVLRAGSLLATVMADGARPFVLSTAFGDVVATATAFAVSLQKERAVLSVRTSSVRVVATGNGEEQQIDAGQRVSFGARGIDTPTRSNGSEAAWVDGYFVLYDGTLGDIVDALRPYRTGLIHISSRASRLPASGAFPLDDTERTLAAIAEALPVTVQKYTDQLIAIDVRS